MAAFHLLRGALLCIATVLPATMPALAGDGNPDAGFGNQGRAIHSWPLSYLQSETNAVATSTDGSVVVAGWVTYPGPPQHDAISLVRFRANGTHDAAFGNAGVALFDLDPASQIGEQALGVFALADGRTLVAARRTIASSHQPSLLAVRANGTADPAFGTNGVRPIDISRWAGSDVQFRTALMQRDGRVLLAGAIIAGSNVDVLVARVLPNGDVDATFGDQGWTRIAGSERLVAAALAFDDLGRIVIAGSTIGVGASDRPVVARLGTDGLLDASFGSGGVAIVDTDFTGNWTAAAVATAVRPILGSILQRRVFIAINRSSPRSTGVLALTSNGAIATGFGNGGFVDLSLEEGTRLTTLAMRADRRLVAAGSIDPNGTGVGDFLVARMGFDGAPDTSFDGNGRARYPMNADGDTFDTPAAMVLSGERPVIAGTLYSSSTPSYHTGVLRLQSDMLFANGFE